MNTIIRRLGVFLSLFTSISSLMCCAIPAVFVLLGAGAVFAGFTSTFPQILWLGQYKTLIFSVGGVLLGVSGILEYRNRHISCRVEGCVETRNWSMLLWRVSVVLYLIGLLFAYILPVLRLF